MALVEQRETSKDSHAQASGNTPAVSLRDVSFSYGFSSVLRDSSLEVAAGEAVCVVGPNGGGKTTLFRLILGLLRPDSGQIRVFGLPPERARGRIGYVPQLLDFDPHFPISAIEVVLMGRLDRRIGGPYSAADREAAMGALAGLGLSEIARRPFDALSVGQRQRVLIARALCSEPDLLLLDEPTANVDAIVEEKLYAILEELRSRMTIMMISHDLAFVHGLFDRVACVHGTVVVHPTAEVSDETIRKIYGGEMRLVRHDQHDHGGEGDGHV